MAAYETDRLTELAEQKLGLLVHLYELSTDQRQLAESHRSDELLAVLSRKTSVIQRLNEVQDELRPFQSQDADERRWRSEGDRVQCRQVFAECERILAELLRIDDETMGEIASQRDLVQQQLQQFHSAEAIQQAYGATNLGSEPSAETSLALDG